MPTVPNRPASEALVNFLCESARIDVRSAARGTVLTEEELKEALIERVAWGVSVEDPHARAIRDFLAAGTCTGPLPVDVVKAVEKLLTRLVEVKHQTTSWDALRDLLVRLDRCGWIRAIMRTDLASTVSVEDRRTELVAGLAIAVFSTDEGRQRRRATERHRRLLRRWIEMWDMFHIDMPDLLDSWIAEHLDDVRQAITTLARPSARSPASPIGGFIDKVGGPMVSAPAGTDRIKAVRDRLLAVARHPLGFGVFVAVASGRLKPDLDLVAGHDPDVVDRVTVDGPPGLCPLPIGATHRPLIVLTHVANAMVLGSLTHLIAQALLRRLEQTLVSVVDLVLELMLLGRDLDTRSASCKSWAWIVSGGEDGLHRHRAVIPPWRLAAKTVWASLVQGGQVTPAISPGDRALLAYKLIVESRVIGWSAASELRQELLDTLPVPGLHTWPGLPEELASDLEAVGLPRGADGQLQIAHLVFLRQALGSFPATWNPIFVRLLRRRIAMARLSEAAPPSPYTAKAKEWSARVSRLASGLSLLDNSPAWSAAWATSSAVTAHHLETCAHCYATTTAPGAGPVLRPAIVAALRDPSLSSIVSARRLLGLVLSFSTYPITPAAASMALSRAKRADAMAG